MIDTSDNLIAVFSDIQINEISSSTIFVNYYESLRQIIEAIATLHGFNVYSHEAFTSFLSEILKEDLMSRKFDRFRLLRNRVNYYGEKIDIEVSKEAKIDMLDIIKKFKDKYLK